MNKIEIKRDFKGVWIPRDIWLNADLSMSEKCLLIEIDSLDMNDRGCFASDLYLATFIQKSEKTVSNLLTDLRKRGYLKSKYDGVNRCQSVVFKGNKTTSRKQEVALPENGKTTSRKREHSNTVSIYIISAIEKITKNIELLEIVAMQNNQPMDVIVSKIEEFVKHSFSVDGEVMDKDLFRHFGNWIRRQDFKVVVVDQTKVDWFINMFNSVCKGNFKATETIKKLFTTQLANGFTADQMKTATRNLYSSDDRNTYHKSKNYQFATPSHLLKDDNLNRYLNQRF